MDTDYALEPSTSTDQHCKNVAGIHDGWPYRHNQQPGARTLTVLQPSHHSASLLDFLIDC
jgi:hypothetical protein